MIKRNLTLFKIDNFLRGFWPLSAVAVIYFQQITHSYTTAMLVFSCISIFQSLFELPSGIISDKIGRRATMIAAALLIFGGYLLWAMAGTVSNLALLFGGAILIGIGNSFLTGSDDALLYETIEELGQDYCFDRSFSENHSYHQLAMALSAALAAGVYFFFPIVALAWLSVLPAMLSCIIAFFYLEPSNINRPTENPWQHFIKSLLLLCRNRRLLNFALLKSFNYSLSAANWRFIGAYYETLIGGWLINIVRVLQETMGFIGFKLMKIASRFEAAQLLFVSVSVNALIKLLALVINTTATPFIMVSSTLFYGVSCTVENTLLQQQFTDRQRATMGSVVSLAGGFMALIVFTLTGIIADLSSARIAIFLLLFFRLIVGLLYPKVLH